MGQHVGKRRVALSQRFRNAKYPRDTLSDTGGNGYFSANGNDFYWTCPENVYEVHVVCVGGGGGGDDAFSGGTSLDGGNSYFIDTNTVAGFGGTAALMGPGNNQTVPGGGFVGDGGGHGGFGNYIAAGTGGRGGGAGGDSANGSPGATSTTDSLNPGGGAGAGGAQGFRSGGGVGVFGEGASGTNGQAGSGGSSASTLGVNNLSVDKNYGGGGGGRSGGHAGAGGGLGWKNNIPVIPGRQYLVRAGGRGESNSGFSTYNGGQGAVRIIYGDARSYPDNVT